MIINNQKNELKYLKKEKARLKKEIRDLEAELFLMRPRMNEAKDKLRNLKFYHG